MKYGRISATTALDGAQHGKRLHAFADEQQLHMHHTGSWNDPAVCASRHHSIMVADTAQLSEPNADVHPTRCKSMVKPSFLPL
jgi:hypothetical protein